MKIWMTVIGLLTAGLLGFPREASAQEKGDTTIYQVVEHMPRFPVCEGLDTTLAFKKACAERELLNFVYSNINYPMEALQQNLQGTVVLSFVVERSGLITQSQVVRDIGGGCGEEALRVVRAMEEMGLRWVPGVTQNGDTVRVRSTLPIRFRIEEPLPYTLFEGDTIYQVFDSLPKFVGDRPLQDFLNAQLVYPAAWRDSCRAGQLEAQLLIRPDGSVRVLEIVDLNELGYDFWNAAVTAITSTFGKWQAARYAGREVPTALSISIPFIPEGLLCNEAAGEYETARQLEREARQLLQEEQVDAALEKLDEALALMPRDATLLLLRGETYLGRNEYDKACVDLKLARSIALVNWYEDVIPVLCR